MSAIPEDFIARTSKLSEEVTRPFGNARKIYVAKGQKLEEFAGGKATKELVAKFLGATGNLRAPTLRVGKNLLVGFNETIYEKIMS